jgi:hypothetical protein
MEKYTTTELLEIMAQVQRTKKTFWVCEKPEFPIEPDSTYQPDKIVMTGVVVARDFFIANAESILERLPFEALTMVNFTKRRVAIFLREGFVSYVRDRINVLSGKLLPLPTYVRRKPITKWATFHICSGGLADLL